MPQQIDHVVLAVASLDEATRSLTRAGFTVRPGGEHTDGLTRNAVVSFADGSYLEVIALADRQAPGARSHRWWDGLVTGGLIDFALLSPDVAAEGAALAANGLAVAGPDDGGRARPDGQQVDWRTVRLAAEGGQVPLPFLIDDRTPRQLRVPDGDAATHPGGYAGIASLTVAVGDLDVARAAYTTLLDDEGASLPVDGAAVPGVPVTAAWSFPLGAQTLVLAESADTRPGPVALTLHAPAGAALPAEPLAGARLALAARPVTLA